MRVAIPSRSERLLVLFNEHCIEHLVARGRAHPRKTLFDERRDLAREDLGESPSHSAYVPAVRERRLRRVRRLRRPCKIDGLGAELGVASDIESDQILVAIRKPNQRPIWVSESVMSVARRKYVTVRPSTVNPRLSLAPPTRIRHVLLRSKSRSAAGLECLCRCSRQAPGCGHSVMRPIALGMKGTNWSNGGMSGSPRIVDTGSTSTRTAYEGEPGDRRAYPARPKLLYDPRDPL